MIYFGIDVHDKKSNYNALEDCGKEIGTTCFPSTKKAYKQHFGSLEPATGCH